MSRGIDRRESKVMECRKLLKGRCNPVVDWLRFVLIVFIGRVHEQTSLSSYTKASFFFLSFFLKTLGIYLQNPLLGSHICWRLRWRFNSILIYHLFFCAIRNRLFGRLIRSLLCPVDLGLFFVLILFLLGLEKCLKIVAIIYLVEEIEFAF